MKINILKHWDILKDSNIEFVLTFSSNLTFKKLDIHMKNLFKRKSVLFHLNKISNLGEYKYSLVIGSDLYANALSNLSNILNFIRDFGYTTNFDRLTFKIGFNSISISNLNPIHLILTYDEKFISNMFRTNILNSIKNIQTSTPHINISDVLDNNFIIPNTNNYGINFNDIKSNSLEFNYCIGNDYEYKFDNIKHIIEYSIIKTHNCITDQRVNISNLNWLKDYLNIKKNKIESISTYDNFLNSYNEKITMTIDLKVSYDFIKYRYNNLKQNLMELIVFNDIKKCRINLDTSRQVLQLKDVKSNNLKLNNYEIFDSHLNGNFSKCRFFNCNINYSNVNNSTFYKNNNIKNSKLNCCLITHENYCYNSIIKSNENQLVSGKYKRCIIDGGNVSSVIDIDSKTEIINKNNI